MVEIIEQEVYPRRVTCPQCLALLQFYEEDLCSRSMKINPWIDITFFHIVCPQCGRKVMVET